METGNLYRKAFITSPLVGILTTLPELLFRGTRPEPGPPPLLIGLFFTLISLVIWIINIELNRWKNKKDLPNNLWIHTLSFAIVLTVTFCLIYFTAPPPPPNAPPRPFPLPPFITVSLLNLLLIIYLESQESKERKQKAEEENQKLKELHLLAQQQQLLNQLNPHFLFNSLSTVKSLVTQNPNQAEYYLIRLSDLLRNTMSQSHQRVLPLGNELEFCDQYLSLQKIRFSKSMEYQISIPESIYNQYQLPVFTLQSLTENALKHNTFTSSQPLKITITFLTDGWIKVSNNKQVKPYTTRPSGTGLNNLTERYRFLGEQEGIKIVEDQENFTVFVKLLSI